MRYCTLLALVLLLGSACRPKAEEPVPPPGFEVLFDGQSLDGWEGDRKTFRIENGAIVGGSLQAPVPRNEFLSHTRTFRDFELRLEFQLRGEGANAGVQIRSERIADHHEMIGYQADLGEGWWGCLYDESRRNRVLAGPPEAERSRPVRGDGWNQYVIRCEGDRIRLWINDQLTVDYREADESIPQQGLIALQIHGGPPSEARYRRIYIRELK